MSLNALSIKLEEYNICTLATKKQCNSLKDEMSRLINANKILMTLNYNLVERLVSETEKVVCKIKRVNNEVEGLKKNIIVLGALVKQWKEKDSKDNAANACIIIYKRKCSMVVQVHPF